MRDPLGLFLPLPLRPLRPLLRLEVGDLEEDADRDLDLDVKDLERDLDLERKPEDQLLRLERDVRDAAGDAGRAVGFCICAGLPSSHLPNSQQCEPDSRL